MNRATIVQAAVLTIVAGLLIMLAGAAPQQPQPAPARSLRPATELEERERDRQLLEEELDRIWRQQQR